MAAAFGCRRGGLGGDVEGVEAYSKGIKTRGIAGFRGILVQGLHAERVPQGYTWRTLSEIIAHGKTQFSSGRPHTTRRRLRALKEFAELPEPPRGGRLQRHIRKAML